MTIIIFIVVLAILILVHEFGHFLVAKWTGMRVDEFGLGFPPRLFSVRKGETRYSINAIPFGGYVKIFGEDPSEGDGAGPEQKRSFVKKPKRSQAAVLAAGVAANIILAWVLISAGFMAGMPTVISEDERAMAEDPRLIVAYVEKSSPAFEAGIVSGDRVLFMQSGGEGIQEPSAEEAQRFISEHGGTDIIMLYKRDGESAMTKLIPREGIGGVPEGQAAIGVSMANVGTVRLAPHLALLKGAEEVFNLLTGIALSIVQLAADGLRGEAGLESVTGPIGIVSLVGNASRLGFLYLLSFTAFISINLAIINLIPFPALDGGRLLFLFIAYLKGSPISPRVAGALNAAGFAVLIIFMVAITYNDIIRLFAS